MPFQSQAQRRYLYANEPEVAKKFEKETPEGVKLPAKLRAMKKVAERKEYA